MPEYYEKPMRALQRAGLSKTTQEAYTRSVTQLFNFHAKEVENYLLHCIHERGWSKATIRASHYGIRFYILKVLEGAKRDRQVTSALPPYTSESRFMEYIPSKPMIRFGTRSLLA